MGAGFIILATLRVNQLIDKTMDGLLLTLQLATILIGCYLLPLLNAFAFILCRLAFGNNFIKY